MDKTVVNITNLNAGLTDNINLGLIPPGAVWKVQSFGATDINLGDHKSTMYVLRWGAGATWTNIRPISLTGNTVEILIEQDFVSHPSYQLNVLRWNRSAYNKYCSFWVKIVERQ
jgi:hypothetical protein